MEQSERLQPSPSRRLLALVALIVAGEAVFFLPFVLPRVFRTTLVSLFGLTETELGIAMAWYGFVAMVAYLPGGPIADRFRSRHLLAISLISTAMGGLVLSGTPSFDILKWLYAYWGLTTIALFWAALIRATRELGGELAQGRAFGWLDGGRGLLAAATGTILVALYASWLPVDVEMATFEQRANAFGGVMLAMTGFTFAAGLLAWVALPNVAPVRDDDAGATLAGVKYAISQPRVWLQSVIIVCAYVGYKSTDLFSKYGSDVLELNEVEAGYTGTLALWVRPVGAIGAGILADRFGATRLMIFSFVLMTVGSLMLASGVIAPGLVAIFLITLATASVGINALRGLYYAIMQDGDIPLGFTGSAVGIVSVIGYTPDIFWGPLSGFLLDKSSGRAGLLNCFWIVSAFSLVGAFAAMLYHRRRLCSSSPHQ